MRKLGFLFVCLLALPAAGQPWSGSGTPNEPYQIWDACDMNAIGADANYWDAHFKLMADINLADYTGTSFNIIGVYVAWGSSRNKLFKGTFDGNGCIIYNFKYKDINKGGVGLFGSTGPESEIRNVYLKDVNVVGYWEVGSLVGYNEGRVDNCQATGFVSGEENIGGLIGVNTETGIIANCSANVDIKTIYHNYPFSQGGLVGYNYEGTVTNCHTTGDINGGTDDDGLYFAGGLIGFDRRGIVIDCSSSGEVSGYGMIGGLIGENQGGYQMGNIENCYARGNVLGTVGAGGLIGRNFAQVINCYASGDITEGNVEYSKVGGLIGWNRVRKYIVSNCYSTGTVSGDSTYVGALIGYHDEGTFGMCFWNSDNNPDVNGIGNGSEPNVIGLTTAQMQDVNTYIDAGWDFNTPVWKFCSVPNYPSLWWEECPVLEPVELIAELLEEVAGLGLPGGIENALEAKLNSALGALEDENENNDAAAVNTLEAFINAVEAQRGNKIPEAEADVLIAAAEEIIELLSDG